MSAISFAQIKDDEEETRFIFGMLAAAQGNLFESGGNLLADVNGSYLKVPAKFTLTQTGQVIQDFFDGTITVDVTIQQATPSLTIRDTDVSAGSSDVVIEADGEPSIALHASDGDTWSWDINTSDQAVLTGTNSLVIERDLVHAGDSDTFIAFAGNSIAFNIGGENDFLRLIQGAGGSAVFNQTGVAGFDFRIESDNEDSAFVVDGGNGTVSIEGALSSATYNFFADAGSNDTYVVTLAGVKLTTGIMVVFTANTLNTDGATLNLNGYGDKAILKNHDSALVTGDIDAGSVVVVVYDGTNFQMTSQLAQ